MKKINFFVAIIALLSISFTANAQVKFGVDAEVGIATNKAEVEISFLGFSTNESASENGFGWNIGAFVDIPAGAIIVQPGLHFGGKKISDSDANIGIEVPVMIGYPIELGNSNLKLRPELGPVFGFGLSSYYGDNDDLKRFRLGLKFGAMLELNNNLAVGLHYDLGLNNQLDIENCSNKWHMFSARIAYTF